MTTRRPRVVLVAQRLQRAALVLRQHPDDDVAWLGAAVEQILAGEARSFELATGLKPRRGENAWSTYRDTALRDAALRELRAQLGDSVSVRAAAKRIHHDLGLYLHGRMQSQRSHQATAADTWTATLHRALEANRRHLPSLHTIRAAIAIQTDGFDSHGVVCNVTREVEYPSAEAPAPAAGARRRVA